jgi:hypothetical protein
LRFEDANEYELEIFFQNRVQQMGKEELPKKKNNPHPFFCPYCGYQHEHTADITDIFSHPMKFQADKPLHKKNLSPVCPLQQPSSQGSL